MKSEQAESTCIVETPDVKPDDVKPDDEKSSSTMNIQCIKQSENILNNDQDKLKTVTRPIRGIKLYDNIEFKSKQLNMKSEQAESTCIVETPDVKPDDVKPDDEKSSSTMNIQCIKQSENILNNDQDKLKTVNMPDKPSRRNKNYADVNLKPLEKTDTITAVNKIIPAKPVRGNKIYSGVIFDNIANKPQKPKENGSLEIENLVKVDVKTKVEKENADTKHVSTLPPYAQVHKSRDSKYMRISACMEDDVPLNPPRPPKKRKHVSSTTEQQVPPPRPARHTKGSPNIVSRPRRQKKDAHNDETSLNLSSSVQNITSQNNDISVDDSNVTLNDPDCYENFEVGVGGAMKFHYQTRPLPPHPSVNTSTVVPKNDRVPEIVPVENLINISVSKSSSDVTSNVDSLGTCNEDKSSIKVSETICHNTLPIANTEKLLSEDTVVSKKPDIINDDRTLQSASGIIISASEDLNTNKLIGDIENKIGDIENKIGDIEKKLVKPQSEKVHSVSESVNTEDNKSENSTDVSATSVLSMPAGNCESSASAYAEQVVPTSSLPSAADASVVSGCALPCELVDVSCSLNERSKQDSLQQAETPIAVTTIVSDNVTPNCIVLTGSSSVAAKEGVSIDVNSGHPNNDKAVPSDVLDSSNVAEVVHQNDSVKCTGCQTNVSSLMMPIIVSNITCVDANVIDSPSATESKLILEPVSISEVVKPVEIVDEIKDNMMNFDGFEVSLQRKPSPIAFIGAENVLNESCNESLKPLSDSKNQNLPVADAEVVFAWKDVSIAAQNLSIVTDESCQVSDAELKKKEIPEEIKTNANGKIEETRKISVGAENVSTDFEAESAPPSLKTEISSKGEKATLVATDAAISVAAVTVALTDKPDVVSSLVPEETKPLVLENSLENIVKQLDNINKSAECSQTVEKQQNKIVVAAELVQEIALLNDIKFDNDITLKCDSEEKVKLSTDKNISCDISKNNEPFETIDTVSTSYENDSSEEDSFVSVILNENICQNPDSGSVAEPKTAVASGEGSEQPKTVDSGDGSEQKEVLGTSPLQEGISSVLEMISNVFNSRSGTPTNNIEFD